MDPCRVLGLIKFSTPETSWEAIVPASAGRVTRSTNLGILGATTFGGCSMNLRLTRFTVPWSFLALFFALLAPACTGDAGTNAEDVSLPVAEDVPVLETLEYRIRVVTVVEGLTHPWSVAFLPDGDMLITERFGGLRLIRDGVLQPEPISSFPEVHANRQGGLMDVVLHPQFAENSLVYLTYSKPGERGATTALARGRFDGARLLDVHDLFVADAWSDTDQHFGSRMAFGPEGMLYMTIGERHDRRRAQDPSDHAGTVVRLRDDGSVPDDNPFIGRTAHKPEIYSYGHRNSQGLAIHPETGAPWATEHGPRGGDEVNLILPGRNYGWPAITYGREYSGELITTETRQAGMEQPQYYWMPGIATSGMTFYTGDRFPAWRGDLFVGGLRGMQLQRVRSLYEDVRPERELLLTELRRRIRDVRQGPDGLLYVLTDEVEEEGAALLRIEPVE